MANEPSRLIMIMMITAKIIYSPEMEFMRQTSKDEHVACKWKEGIQKSNQRCNIRIT